MTSEKPSMPELIYYCEFDPEKWDERLEITFSNRHIVTAEFQGSENEEPQIHIDIQSKESAIPRDFFGKNILNISAIIGKNGVGKTNIFKRIFYEESILGKSVIKIFKDIDWEGFYVEEIGDCFKLYCNSSIQLIEKKEIKGSNNSLLFYNVFSNESIDSFGNNLFTKEFKLKESLSSFYYLLKGPQSVSDQYVKMAQDFYEYFKINILDQILNIEFTSISQLVEVKDKYPKLYDKTCSFSDIDDDSRYKFILNVIFLEIYLNLVKDKNSINSKNMKNSNQLKDIENDDLDQSNIKISTYINGELLRLRSANPIKVDASSISTTSFSNVYNQIMHLFDDIPNSYKKIVDGRLVIDFSREPYNQNIFGLLEYLETIQENLYNVKNYDLVNIRLGNYSSGEQKLLYLVSSIIEKILGGEHYRDLESSRKIIVLVLDEFDENLHPNWVRSFFQYLSIFLKYMNDVNDHILFQIILSTHSPYLISDLPKENIRLIAKDEITGKREVSIPKHGFASNYYDILSDSFFLEDTIGEFAKQKINGWITELNDLEKSAISDQEKLEKIDKIKELIMIVDDQFIRNKLLEFANDIKNKIIRNTDKNLRKSLIDAEIAKLKKMKEKLKYD